MASDSLLTVIAGLVKRESRIAKEADDKAKAKLKAEAEKEKEEDDEDEDPVGDPTPAGKDTATKPEKEPEEKPEKEPEEKPEKEPKDDNGEGDTKPSGPDPTLVAQVAAIVKKEIEDDEKEKKEKEIKLSGKKEKIDTKPSMEQISKGKMNFREAIRASVTGSPLVEGYESHVLAILDDEGIKGPLGYEPFFEKGKLFVMRGQERSAQKALKNSGEINKIPKIVGEELDADEYLAMESVSVDGRCKGFKEALRRLTYEKIKAMKEKEKSQNEGAEKDTKGDKEAYQKFFQAALKKFGVTEPDQLEGDKKKAFFDYIDKGWKADNEKPEPEDKKEEVEIEESQELQAIMALDDVKIKADINLKGEIVVSKKDVKKAEAALKKSFKKGKIPKIVGEEVELEEHCGHCEFGLEEKVKYDLYHKTFSDAMQHAYEIAKKQGFVVDPKEIDDKVATGPKKPSSGKTNRYILGTDKKKNLHVQVANLDNKRYELNMYIEGFEPVEEEEDLDEKKTKIKKIKGGKLIKKVTSDKAGYKMQGGKEVRMKAPEQRKRKIGGKKGFKKKKGKLAQIQRKSARSMLKRSRMNMEFTPEGQRLTEGVPMSAYDKVKSVRSGLMEGLDRHAVAELKLYIENDSELYSRQIVPIIKNIQRKMKSGKYDHTKAPKLWMYLVDNGAKKYVKEFGGDVRSQFPKDVRHSVAVEFANEYRAEIESQGGEMV